MVTVPTPSQGATCAFDMHQPLLHGVHRTYGTHERRSNFGGRLRIERNRLVYHLELNEIQAWLRDSRKEQNSPMLTNTKDSEWHRLQLIAMFRNLARPGPIDVEKTPGGLVSGLQTSYTQSRLIESDHKVSEPRIRQLDGYGQISPFCP